MKTITCPACATANDHQAERCAKCGESLALPKLQATLAEMRDITARFEHKQAVASGGGFSSINGFGTTLIDYRPRGDGTWEAVRWVIAAGIPLVPLGGYVIQPRHQEATYGRRTASFTVLDRFRAAPARIARIYLLILTGVLPLVLGWMNAGWLNRTIGDGKAFFVMLGAIVWAGYFVYYRTWNDGGVYKPVPPPVAA